MKLHAMMHGWSWELRHCWWRYVVTPFNWERYPPCGPKAWSIGVFGFVFFVDL